MHTSPAFVTDIEQLLADLDAMAVRALQRHAAVDTSTLSDDELVRLSATTAGAIRGLEAIQIAVAGEIVDRSRTSLGANRLCAKKGCRTASELLQRVTQSSSVSVSRLQKVATAIREEVWVSGASIPPRFPVLAQALRCGRLGLDSAAAIVGGLSVPSLRVAGDAIAAAESELVDAALGASPECPIPATPDEIRLQASVWRSLIDPDGVEPDEERALSHRSIRLGAATSSGVPLSGMLIPEAAARLQRLFDAYLSPISQTVAFPGSGSNASSASSHDSDSASGADDAVHGIGVADARSRAQQQHDVVLAVLDCATRSAETPRIGGASPTVLVTVSQADLVTVSQANLVTVSQADLVTVSQADLDGETGKQAVRGVAWIEGVDAPVSIRTARQMICAGGVQKVLTADSGRILRLDAEQRCFTGWQRRAIVLRDGGCIIPGCRIPASWCEIHHVERHSDGGPTHIDNGVLVCWFHHRTIETSGWQIRMRGGVPEVKAPPWLGRGNRVWAPATQSRPRLSARLSSALPRPALPEPVHPEPVHPKPVHPEPSAHPESSSLPQSSPPESPPVRFRASGRAE